MDSKACRECGHPLSAVEKICPRCGARQRSLFLFGIILGAVLAIAFVLIYATSVDYSRRPQQAMMTDSDVGPGSKYSIDHPELIPNVRTMITARGYHCPEIVNLWNETGSGGENRLEAICGPDKNHIEASLHYAVYSDSRKVNRCRPWREFGPDCS
jgi:hypothetical protein